MFERLPLADFGNRVPQFTFEVCARPVGSLDAKHTRRQSHSGSRRVRLRDVPTRCFRGAGAGVSRAENVDQLAHASDVAASLDQLGALCPDWRDVTLVVSWFGDDLRAGALRARAEVRSRTRGDDVRRLAGGGNDARDR